MEITFERDALYEEVWKEPLTDVARRNRLSDNGLRKVCKALNVPMPPRGYWAQIAAGQHIPKAPLPAECQRTTFVSHPLNSERTYHTEDDDKWLASRIEFESSPANLIEFELQPKRWHPALAQLRDSLRDAAKEIPRIKRDSERAEKHPHLRQMPNYTGWKWKQFWDDGQVLRQTHHCAVMRVTPQTFERALGIANALCLAAQARGFSVDVDDKAGRLVFEGHNARVELRMTERLEDAWRKEIGWDKKPTNTKYKTPSGELRLFVGGKYEERMITDSSNEPIENKLNEVFIKIYGRVVRQLEGRRQHEEWNRQYQEEQRRREEAEARRRALEAQRAEERRKREALLKEAIEWRNAVLIREYVAFVEGTNDLAKREAGWADWARSVAQAMDPTAKEG